MQDKYKRKIFGVNMGIIRAREMSISEIASSRFDFLRLEGRAEAMYVIHNIVALIGWK